MSIAQTSDGYVWIGTRSGLVRYDGAHFVPFTFSAGESLRSPRVLSLLADRDGSLWIGTGADLEHWIDGKLVHFPPDKAFVFGYILSIHQARDGGVWITRARASDGDGPFCKVTGLTLHCYGQRENLNLPYAVDALEDKQGHFWIIDDTSLVHWDPATLQALPGSLDQVGVVDNLQSLAFDSDGALLVSIAQLGRAGGLARFDNGQLRSYSKTGLDVHQFATQRVFSDSRGSLWIGTLGQGIYRVNGDRVDHYRTAEGLSNDTINGFMEDREGNIWVLTNQGVDRFRDLPVITYSAREGLSGDNVAAVLAARNGDIWINNFNSLDRLHGEAVTSLRANQGLPGEAVTSLFEDRDTRLWVGIDDSLQILSNGMFTPVMKIDGGRTGNISAMTQDRAGDLWAISNVPNPYGSLLRIRDAKVIEVVPFATLALAKSAALAADPTDGVWLALVNGDFAHWHDNHADIIRMNRAPRTGFVTGLVHNDGDALLASTMSGLVGIRDGRAQVMTENNGLPCTILWTLVVSHEATWLYSECGLLSISNAEMAKWWHDSNAKLAISKLDALDGVQPASAGWSPKSAVAPDGRVWFANSSVLQMVDPAATHPPRPDPLVQIERINVSGTGYPVKAIVALQPLSRDVQIDYTAPSFATPERVRFRYFMEGVDDQWVDAGPRRTAFYNLLNPGRYRFRVIASNDGEVWTGTGAQFELIVPPTFYQTKWFRALCIAAALAVMWLLFNLRIQQIKNKLRARLDERVEERERIARDLHDTFFQGVQGLLLTIDSAKNDMDPGERSRLVLEEALKQSDRVMAEGRELVLDLRSQRGESADLAAVLAEDADGFKAIYSSEVSVSVVGNPQRINELVYEDIYRLTREATLNAFQHAKATHIEVEITYERSSLRLYVRDNGVGIESSIIAEGGRPDHWGIPGMKERAKRIGAVLNIWSAPGAGTEIEMKLSAKVAYAAERRPLLWMLKRRRNLSTE